MYDLLYVCHVLADDVEVYTVIQHAQHSSACCIPSANGIRSTATPVHGTSLLGYRSCVTTLTV